MSKSNKDHHEELQLEDLLQLKKAEKPSDAFWQQFDRELHQRMLQTLVKKDAWYLQFWRGLSGRIGQSAFVTGAAAVLAMIVVQPALVSFFPDAETQVAGDAFSNDSQEVLSVALAASVADLGLDFGSADFQIQTITAADSQRDKAFKREFAMDTFGITPTSAADYSGDVAGSWLAFNNAGVASLVY